MLKRWLKKIVCWLDHHDWRPWWIEQHKQDYCDVEMVCNNCGTVLKHVDVDGDFLA